jgi:hypothetical protein
MNVGDFLVWAKLRFTMLGFSLGTSLAGKEGYVSVFIVFLTLSSSIHTSCYTPTYLEMACMTLIQFVYIPSFENV